MNIAKRVAAAYAQSTRVAAVQYKPKFKDPDFNRWQLRSLAMMAANKGAKIIVLPELATTGYSFMSKKEAAPFAEPLEGQTVAALSWVARKFECYIACGVMTRDGDSIYNSQILVGPSGLVAHYHKMNFWGNDRLWATAGTEKPPIIQTPHGKLGLLICKDVRDKRPGKTDQRKTASDEFYDVGDADIVAFSTNWGDGEFPSGTWVSFALKNGVWLVVSNRCGGAERANFFDGGVCVISPEGVVQVEGLDFESDCIVYGTVGAGKTPQALNSD